MIEISNADTEAEKPTLSPDLLSRENPPLTCAPRSSGSLYKDMEEGRVCCLPTCVPLRSKSIPSLALEPTSLGFQHKLKTS